MFKSLLNSKPLKYHIYMDALNQNVIVRPALKKYIFQNKFYSFHFLSKVQKQRHYTCIIFISITYPDLSLAL